MRSSGSSSSRLCSASYLGIIALAILPLGGCGYVTALTADDTMTRHDASVSSSTATISDAGPPFGPSCRVVQDSGHYREVVIDAGAVNLQISCSRITGILGDQIEQLGRAELSFHAELGRHYQIEVREDFGFPHVAVIAAQDDSQVIYRSLLDSRVASTPSTEQVTLVSRSGADVIPCKFGRPWADRRASSVRRPAGSFVQVPYSHQIIAECSTYAYASGDVKERYEAPVDFVPVSGRLYTVHMDKENRNFVFVTDVSSDVQTIAHVKATRTY